MTWIVTTVWRLETVWGARFRFIILLLLLFLWKMEQVTRAKLAFCLLIITNSIFDKSSIIFYVVTLFANIMRIKLKCDYRLPKFTFPELVVAVYFGRTWTHWWDHFEKKICFMDYDTFHFRLTDHNELDSVWIDS